VKKIPTGNEPVTYAEPDTAIPAPADEQEGEERPSTGAPHRKRRLPAKAIGALLLLAALIAIGAIPKMLRSDNLAASAKSVRLAVTEVNVVSPRLTQTGVLALPSTVQAIEEATINARTAGYLKTRYVDIGSRVRAGEVLAVIESPETDQQVLQAQADAEKAIAGTGQATADVARLEAGVAQSQSDLAKSQSNLAETRAQLAHFQAKLDQAKAYADVARARLNQTEQVLASRRADKNWAVARYVLASKTLARWKELEKVEAVSGQEVDEKQADNDASQANVEAAQDAISSAQADVNAAQAAYVSSQAEVQAARDDVTAGRARVRAAGSAVASSEASVTASRSSVVAGRESLNASQAEVRSSEAGAHRWEALRSFERVVAPFPGVITARNLDVGSLINAGNASTDHDPNRTVSYSGIFNMARTDTVRILVQVPEDYVSAIQPGQKARVTIQELPGRVFTGTVYRTAGALDDVSRTLLTEIHVANPQNVLLPGMYARVEFANSRAIPSLRIPADALIFDAKGTRVAEVTPADKIHFQSVATGRDYGSEIEIKSGLKGNERLVSNPTDDLADGMRVHVVKSPN
jgi:RND family efflux transporter MFP subunit